MPRACLTISSSPRRTVTSSQAKYALRFQSHVTLEAARTAYGHLTVMEWDGLLIVGVEP